MTLYTVKTRQEMGYPAPNWWQVAPLYSRPRGGIGGQDVRVILPREWASFYYWLNLRYNHDIENLMRWMINNRDSILLEKSGLRWPEALDGRVGWPMIAIGGNPVKVVDRVRDYYRIEGLQAEVPNLDVKNPETDRHLFHIIYGKNAPQQKTPHGIGIMPLLDPRYFRFTGGDVEGLFIHESWLKDYQVPEVLTALEPPVEEPKPQKPVYIALEQLKLRDKPGGELMGMFPRGGEFTLDAVTKHGNNIWGEISGRWAVLYWGIWRRYTTTWRQN